MKLRSRRPQDIHTKANAKTNKHHNHPRPSVDEDFAPSVTPSTADSDFPRFFHYYAPLDPTWRPKQNLPSPETPEPKIKMKGKPPSKKKLAGKEKTLHIVRNSGILKSPRSKGRTASHASSFSSSAAAATGTIPFPPPMVHFDRETLTRTPATEPEPKPRYSPATLAEARAPAKANSRKFGAKKVMTLRDLPSSPRSPRDRRVSHIRRSGGGRGSKVRVRAKANGNGDGDGLESQVMLADPKRASGEQVRRKDSTKLSPGSRRREDFYAALEELMVDADARRGSGGKEKDQATKGRGWRRASSARRSWSGTSSASIERIREFENKHRQGQRLGSLTWPPEELGWMNTNRASLDSVSDRSALLRRRGRSFVVKGGEEDATTTEQGVQTAKVKMGPSATEPLTDKDMWSLEDATQQIPQLLRSLEEYPQRLTLSAVGPSFTYLQTQIQDFAEEHFSFSLSPSQRATWPLHELGTRYLPLMLVTQYIADGSQYGWRNFFTNPASRVALVQGVLGEWLKQKVFNHTCFGLTTEQTRELEDMDREYLHHDAFLRSKKRAVMVQGFMKENLQKGGGAKDGVPLPAIRASRDELMVVLAPLMEGFMPKSKNVEGEDDDEEEDVDPEKVKKKVSDGLWHIVWDAVKLHRAIRVLGRDGTIVRIAPAVQKGERYYQTAPFHIVNDVMVKKTKSHGVRIGRWEDGKLAIKMTCFGRIEAYVPHGPDYEELVAKEAEIRKLMRRQGLAKGEFNWEDHAASVWPELPESVVLEEKRKAGEWREEIGDNRKEEKMYGCYVTCHMRLAPHQVYCEWVPEGEVDAKAIEEGDEKVVELDEEKEQGATSTEEVYGWPLPKNQRVSLNEAVQKARKEAGLWKNSIEDGARKAWNFACKWESVPEVIVLAWFIQSWVRGGTIADAGRAMGMLGSAEGRLRVAQQSMKAYGRGRELLSRVGRGVEAVGGRVRKAVGHSVQNGRVEKAVKQGGSKVIKEGKKILKHVKVEAGKG